MPNGFHGPRESWDRIEASLLPLDPGLSAYATQHGMSLSRNDHDWPERSLAWGRSVSRKIQIYLEDENALTWNFWLCASEDRSSKRYWKHEFLRRSVPIEEISGHLDGLLEQGRLRLDRWSSGDLELATDSR